MRAKASAGLCRQADARDGHEQRRTGGVGIGHGQAIVALASMRAATGLLASTMRWRRPSSASS
jgi:hypothetical protein